MTTIEKKFNKRSKRFNLIVNLRSYIPIEPSTYDHPMTLKEIIDFEVHGDGWKDNERYLNDYGMEKLSVTTDLPIGKKEPIVPVDGQNLVANDQIIALDESEMKILRFLFKHGYDFLNKEMNKTRKCTHSIAQEYEDILDSALDRTQMLENKIFDNDLIMVESGLTTLNDLTKIIKK
jgi:hypothetical protein